jgi:hypothetical protein
MSYLFIKNLFQREKFVLFSINKKKLKNPKKNPKKNIFSGFLVVFFGFFWVGFLLPTLVLTPQISSGVSAIVIIICICRTHRGFRQKTFEKYINIFGNRVLILKNFLSLISFLLIFAMLRSA